MTKKKSEVILPSKKKKAKSSKTAKKNMNLYSSLAYNHRVKKEANARRRAEELAKLPKEPVKRFFQMVVFLARPEGNPEVYCRLFSDFYYHFRRSLPLL